MKQIKEQIPEIPVIRDWGGARVIVTMEVPPLKMTYTSQMIIDERDVEMLRGMLEPKHLENASKLRDIMHFQLMMARWEADRIKAERVLGILSHKISMEIANAISRAFEDKERG